MCTTAVGTIELKQLFPAQRQNNCSDFNCFWQAEAGRNRESLCRVCTTLAGGFKTPKPIAEHAWMACIFPSNYNQRQPSVSPIITQTQAVRPTQEDKTVTWQRCLKCESCLMTVREHSKYSAELNILWNMAWWTPSHCSQTVRESYFFLNHMNIEVVKLLKNNRKLLKQWHPVQDCDSHVCFTTSRPVTRIKCWQLMFLSTADTSTFIGLIGYVPYWHFYKTFHDLTVSGEDMMVELRGDGQTKRPQFRTVFQL